MNAKTLLPRTLKERGKFGGRGPGKESLGEHDGLFVVQGHDAINRFDCNVPGHFTDVKGTMLERYHKILNVGVNKSVE